jgi:hypothetical protein
MALVRTHILLEPEQQRKLAELARRKGRSVSDLARELIQQGLEAQAQEYTREQAQRLAALEGLSQLRKAIREESPVDLYQLDITKLIQENRDERDSNNLGYRD